MTSFLAPCCSLGSAFILTPLCFHHACFVFSGEEACCGAFLAVPRRAIWPFQLPRLVPHSTGLVRSRHPAVRLCPSRGES